MSHPLPSSSSSHFHKHFYGRQSGSLHHPHAFPEKHQQFINNLVGNLWKDRRATEVGSGLGQSQGTLRKIRPGDGICLILLKHYLASMEFIRYQICNFHGFCVCLDEKNCNNHILAESNVYLFEFSQIV